LAKLKKGKDCRNLEFFEIRVEVSSHLHGTGNPKKIETNRHDSMAALI
jgi:hypothetical protein